MLVELLAWAGAALSALLCIPQAVRTLHARQLDGVSAATYWIVLANAGIWGAWVTTSVPAGSSRARSLLAHSAGCNRRSAQVTGVVLDQR